MHVQVVNFNLNNLSHEAFADFCIAIAPQFARVPGLISKVWLSDRENNTYGGVYEWENRAAMEAFSSSELFKSVVSNPSLANLSSKDFEILDKPSSVTNGVREHAEAS